MSVGRLPRASGLVKPLGQLGVPAAAGEQFAELFFAVHVDREVARRRLALGDVTAAAVIRHSELDELYLAALGTGHSYHAESPVFPGVVDHVSSSMLSPKTGAGYK